LKDLLPFLQVEIVKERYTGKKLRFIGSLLRGKIA